MNEHIKNTEISRRSVVKGVAGLTFSFALGGAMVGRPFEALAADVARFNALLS